MKNIGSIIKAKLQGKNGWLYVLGFVILPIVAIAIWQSYLE
jgi:hypothetical protein